MNKCLTCGKDVKNKYCNTFCQNKNQPYRAEKRTITLYGEIKEFIVICNKCNKQFTVKEREKLFPSKLQYHCSRKCANSQIGRAHV